MKWVRSRPATPDPIPRRAGRKRKPQTPAESDLQTLDRAISARRRRITPQARAFISHYVASGQKDPVESARIAGYAEPSRATRLVLDLQDLIEAEVLRGNIGRTMELEEAQMLVGRLARSADDDRVKLAALRTVLEVDGALNSKNAAVDRSATARGLEKLVALIRGKMNGGGNAAPRVRARLQVDVDTHPESVTPSLTPCDVTSVRESSPARDPDPDSK